MAASGARCPVRQGDWIQTAHGRQMYPLDPRVDEVHIDDIGHALARQCRFAGHVRCGHYSVAQHSVLVSQVCDKADARWGLLHDASEAYLVDLPRPLKRLQEFASYRAIEKNLMDVICERFGLPPVEPASVKWADNVLLATEARDLMAPPPAPWVAMPDPLDEVIVPWSAEEAERRFRARFEELAA